MQQPPQQTPPVQQQPGAAPTGLPPANNQVVPVPAPGAPVAYKAHWNTSLFDCCSDLEICCYGCCCRHCLYGSTVMNMSNGKQPCAMPCALTWCIDCVLTCCGTTWPFQCSCIVTHTLRQAVRERFLLPQEPCNDILVHCCCQPCAICQEAREIKYQSRQPNWPGKPYDMVALG